MAEDLVMALLKEVRALRTEVEAMKEERGVSPDLMDTAQAAKFLDFAVSTLEKFRTYGGGPRFVKISRKVRYRREDLELWRDSTVCRVTADAHF